MIPVKVTKISYDSEGRNYVVILQEISGNKFLPVIVGSFEAQAIALAIESVETPRPLTHDLICDFIIAIESTLKKIRINNLQEGVFFAQLDIESNESAQVHIDARPSDAIALALRMGTPIFVDSQVMDDAGLLLEDTIKENQKSPFKNKKKLGKSLQRLKEKMQIAIAEEEYEIAAKLRDKISELKS